MILYKRNGVFYILGEKFNYTTFDKESTVRLVYAKKDNSLTWKWSNGIMTIEFHKGENLLVPVKDTFL